MSTQEDDTTTDQPTRPDKPIVAIVLGVLAIAALVFAALSHEWLYAGSTQLQIILDDGPTTTVGPVHEVSFGLREVTRCQTRDGQSTCESQSISELQRVWETNLLTARYVAGEHVDDSLRETGGDVAFANAAKQRDLMSQLFEGDSTKILGEVQRDLTAAKQVYRTSWVFPLLGLIALIACIVAAISLAIAVAFVLAGKRIRLPIMPTTTALLGVLVALISGCLYIAFKPGPPGYVGVGLSFFVFGGGVVLGLWSSLKLNKLMRPHDPDLLDDAMNESEF